MNFTAPHSGKKCFSVREPDIIVENFPWEFRPSFKICKCIHHPSPLLSIKNILYYSVANFHEIYVFCPKILRGLWKSGVGWYIFILYYTLKYQKYTLYFKVWPFSLKYTFFASKSKFFEISFLKQWWKLLICHIS